MLDNIKPMDCNMSPEQFAKDVSLQSRLVKILGCNKNWPANLWTFDSLLSRDNGQWNWKANFVDDSGLVKNTSDQVKFSQESFS